MSWVRIVLHTIERVTPIGKLLIRKSQCVNEKHSPAQISTKIEPKDQGKTP
jgi:hypothetical protein